MYNNDHPEKRKDEIWITNCDNDGYSKEKEELLTI